MLNKLTAIDSKTVTSAGDQNKTNLSTEFIMSGAIEAKLADLGITLPEAAAPAANYVPYVKSGNQLFISARSRRPPLAKKSSASSETP